MKQKNKLLSDGLQKGKKNESSPPLDLPYLYVFDSHGPDDSSGNVVPLASMVVLPKHSYLPDIPMDSNLYFEGMLFVFGIITMCLQYINLYKTVWWLPQSHAQYALVS